MKKTILLLLISFNCLSQQYTSSNPQYKWGAWEQIPCYKGIYVRVQKAYFNKSVNNWYWNWEIQNRYSKKMSVSFRFYDSQMKDDIMRGETTGRVTLQPNEIRSNGGFGREDKIDWKFEKLCFEFRIYNGSELDNCAEDPAVFKKDFYYATCDTGTPNYKKYNGANNQSNSSLTSQNSNSTGATQATLTEQINALSSERMEICTELAKKNNTTSCTNESLNTLYFDQIRGTEAEQLSKKRNYAKALEEDVIRLRAILNQSGGNSGGRNSNSNNVNAAEEQTRKALQTRGDNIQNYMNKGEAAYDAGRYDDAASNFTQAANVCSDEPQFQQQKNLALQAKQRAVTAKEAEARKARIEEKQRQEQVTNTATSAALAGAVGLMTLLEDEYSDNPFAARMQFGVGIENMPIIMQNDLTGIESVEAPMVVDILAGMTFTFANHKAINLHLNPYFEYGVVAFQPGYSGFSLKYGGNAMLQMALNNDHAFKLFAEGGYYGKQGSLNYDADVASGGTTASDNITSGTTSYSSIRYGGGIMLHKEAIDGEIRIKPGIFYEKFSFAKNSPVMSFNLHANILSKIVIELTYSKNYAIPGLLLEPSRFLSVNKDFWSVKIIRQGLLNR